jgi:hypothetical protein
VKRVAPHPGVTTIQPNGPSAFFTNIRGVAQNDFSGDHQESPVAIYVDEAYVSALGRVLSHHLFGSLSP